MLRSLERRRSTDLRVVAVQACMLTVNEPARRFVAKAMLIEPSRAS